MRSSRRRSSPISRCTSRASFGCRSFLDDHLVEHLVELVDLLLRALLDAEPLDALGHVAEARVALLDLLVPDQRLARLFEQLVGVADLEPEIDFFLVLP